MDNEIVRKANKGEWSELYVLFKLFTERKIAAAGADLRPLEDKYYHFLKILRTEVPGKQLEYSLAVDGEVAIRDATENTPIKVVETRQLASKTATIFEAIKAGNSSSFAVQEMVSLMDEYLITKVKAGSLEKTDLLAVVSDRAHDTSQQLGFSIKSHVGGAPTLVNSSGHTNFVYSVEGFTGDIASVNDISGDSKVRKRLARIRERGGTFTFDHIKSSSFTSNLRFTDTAFPLLLSRMVLDYYCGKGARWPGLTDLVSHYDDIDSTTAELAYKLKGFLRSAALGMVPSKLWDTTLSAYGGYIVVLDDGTLVCYHLFNDDEFKDYLFHNTKLDTPSTTKYKFGELYYKDGKLLLNLNLQIRFLK